MKIFKPILALILALCLFSCTQEEHWNQLKSKVNFEAELTQQFIIPTNDSILSVTGAKGTVITFNTNDLEGLVDSNGSNKDSLRVNLIELVSPEDLLKANAQTISNGQWLISGGAFKIDIEGYGPLTLKEGKTIDVRFPVNTTENNMKIFYGSRDENNNMNWQPSETMINERSYYSILYKEEELRIITESRMGDSEASESTIKADSLGDLTINDFERKHPELDTLLIINDTLRGIDSYRNIEDIRERLNGSEVRLQPLRSKIYESVSLTQLGWINIDKFAPEVETVNITFNYNEKMDAVFTYLVDADNNTILNVVNENLDIPKKRRFYILSFGLKNGTYYTYKKAVRFNEDKTHSIEMKDIKGSNFSSMFQLKM